MSVTSWRSLVLMLSVSILAIGLSLRPAPLQSSDLHGPRANAANQGNTQHTAVSETAEIGDLSTLHAQPRISHTISWGVLRTLDYVNGSMSTELRSLNGKRVRVPGFIVPLDDFQDEVTEFLLVPYFGACVHTPPPPPNQIVFVRIKGGKQKVSLFEPVWIEGPLTIATYQSIYGAVGFQIAADRITPYR